MKWPDRVVGDYEPDWGTLLRCAGCGGDWTHQGRVEVFERHHEDSPHGTHVTVHGARVSVDDRMVGNPSGRRQGLTILLSCENCDAGTEVLVWQHKGQTFLDVRPAVEPIYVHG